MANDTTIKVKPTTYERLGKRKGFNGCVSFDDVLNNLMDQEEDQKQK